MNEIKEDLKRWRDTSHVLGQLCYGIHPYQLIYSFGPNQSPTSFSIGIDELILKFIWKRTKITKTILGKEQNRRTDSARLQDSLQSQATVTKTQILAIGQHKCAQLILRQGTKAPLIGER